MVGLLMTRPQMAAQRFVEELDPATRAKVTPIFAPLIEPRPVAHDLGDPFSGDVIFSSANAVAFAPRPADPSQRAYCVGARTTSAAAQIGWTASCAGQDSDGLVANLIERCTDRPLVHLRGIHSRGFIAQRLRDAGVSCTETVIYDQPALGYEADTERAMDAQDVMIVPLFSPRTAAQFVKLAPYRAELCLLALSDAVAEPLKRLNCKDLQICKAPTGEQMHILVRDAAARLARVEGGPSAQ